MNLKNQRDEIETAVMEALGTGQFAANGVTYHIIAPEALTGERYTAYRRAEIEISSAMSLERLHENYDLAIKQLQGMTKLGDAHTALDILLNNIKGVENFLQQPQAEIYRFCSVFCIREGEERKTFDPQVTGVKIHDWETEGIANGFFFLLAANIINGFITLYSRLQEATVIMNDLALQTAVIEAQPITEV